MVLKDLVCFGYNMSLDRLKTFCGIIQIIILSIFENVCIWFVGFACFLLLT